MTDHVVRPDVAMFLQFLNNAPSPKMHEVSAPDARAMMMAMRDIADAPVGELAICRDYEIPGPAGKISARLYDCRPEREAGPIMVFFHGGGFVIGNIDTHEPYCAEACRLLDMPVISIDYRLAPEHPFPAGVEDCEAAARWVAENGPTLGLDLTGMVLSGDSAGGNLTIVTAMALRDRPAAIPVILQHPIYPAVSEHQDWQSMRDFAQGYLLTEDSIAYFSAATQADPGDWRSAPLNFDQTGMPPTMITTAGLDPLRDQGIAYTEKLRASGIYVEYRNAEGNIHGHINLRKGIPSSQADIEGNLALVRKMLDEIKADA